MRTNTLFRLKIAGLAFVTVQLVDGWLPAFASTTQASETNVEILDSYANALDAQSERLTQLPTLPMSPSCENRYEKMWADGQLKIDFYYGYLGSDQDPVVADRLMRYTMVHQLMKPCSKGLGACGFKMTEDLTADDGPYVLRKTTARGEIVLSIWDSAHGNWKPENTIGLPSVFVANKSQAVKTKKIWESYFRSYRDADVVIYDGHSELGTGPGFAPMGLLQFSTERFFKQNLSRFKRGVKVDTLHQPAVIVLAACESKKYYLKDYRKLFPEAALLLTDHNQQFQAGEQTVFSLIDSLTQDRCAQQMDDSLHSTGFPDAGTHVYNFD